MRRNYTCARCGVAIGTEEHTLVQQVRRLQAENRNLLAALAWSQPSADYREIPLTKGYVAVVDVADFVQLARYAWFAEEREHGAYACRMSDSGTRRAVIKMHQQVMGSVDGNVIDHINRNGLDNRRSNLRHATTSQNNANSPLVRSNNTSGLRGVSWSKFARKWHAQIAYQKRNYHLGYFTSPEKAAAAYNARAIELYGEFAVLNPPEFTA